MSKAEPVFGIDIAYPYQKDIDLGLVNEQGYKFVVAKATEGPYRDGTSYTNPLFSQWRERAQQLGLIFGAYAFLVETPAKPQADLFLKTAGDVSGMILMLDFEASNPPYQYLTPSNQTLRGFVAELRSRVGKHPIVLYSNRSFWNGGTPSGTSTSTTPTSPGMPTTGRTVPSSGRGTSTPRPRNCSDAPASLGVGASPGGTWSP